MVYIYYSQLKINKSVALIKFSVALILCDWYLFYHTVGFW